MSPLTLDITFGSYAIKNQQAGLGFTIGPQFALGSAGASLQYVPYDHEQQKLQGVCLRIPRRIFEQPEWGDADAKEQAKSILEMFFQSIEKNSENWVKTLLTRFPNLSITHLDNVTESNTQINASIEGFVQIGFGKIKLGLAAGINYLHKLQRNFKQKDSTGERHVKKIRRTNTNAFTAFASVRTPAVLYQSNDFYAQNSTNQIFGISSDVKSSEDILRQETIYENGLISDKSFIEMEHDDPSAFVSTINNMLTITSPLELETAKKIQQSFKLDEKNTQPPHSKIRYGQRYQFTPEAIKKINELYVKYKIINNKMLNQKINQSWLLKKNINNKMQAFFNNPTNYHLTSLRVYARGIERTRLNLDMGICLDKTKQSYFVKALCGNNSFPSQTKVIQKK